MSWGVDIVIDHADGYTTTVEVVSGHTYNLTPMWRKAGVFETSRDHYGGFLEILTRFAQLAWEHPTGTLRWNG
jgi:hypothetical protein